MPTVSRRGRTKKPARKVTRKAWSRGVEAASLALDAANHAAARKAFGELSRADQLCLAYEVAYTRRRELTLAYENVITVTSGLKHSRVGGSGKSRRGRPCVIFVVRRKWKKDAARANARQQIPGYLLAYWASTTGKTLCAVPTDVIIEHGFYNTVSESLSGVRVNRRNKPNESYGGNVACVARITKPNGVSEDMMLSCLHVFSPLPEINTEPPAAGAAVHILPETGRPAIGASAAFGGALWWVDGASGPRHSFDVQLASIDSLASLMHALQGYTLSKIRPYIGGLQELYALGDIKFRILASPYNPMRTGTGARNISARYENNHPPEAGWNYAVSIGSQPASKPIHPGWLVDLRLLGEHTADGDSGSPVVVELENDGFTLVGMHIARSDRPEGTFSVIIPAWQLFEAERYKGVISAIQPISPELAQSSN